MAEQVRWGILGTGNIARQFATGLDGSKRGRIVAVASRSIESATAFGRERRIPSLHTQYNDLLANPEVDAVYNSLPNNLHHEWTIRALRAGKHVLCEKPFAANAQQAREMFDEARRAGRVLIEAFMYRSHPVTHAVLDAVRGGAIGTLKLIRTSFCYRTKRVDQNIRFRRELAGGALMDVGCYCVSLSRLVARAEPVGVHAVGHVHASGVDDVVAATLAFPGGVVASFTCGMSVHADNTAYLCGDEGYIEIPVPWKPQPRGATYTVARSTPPKMDLAASTAPLPPPRETFTVDAGLDIFGLAADDFAGTVLDGKPPTVSEQDTVGNMVVLDELRRQVGLSY